MSRIESGRPPSTSATDVMVCAGDAMADLCWQFRAALAVSDLAPARVDTGSLAATLHEPDLLIQIVGSADMSAALAQMATVRAATPGCAVIVAAVDLQSAQIDSLLAAGACDFVRVPVVAEELCVRVHRALGICSGEAISPPRPTHPALRDLIGDSPVFVQQVARVPLLASTTPAC